MSGDAAYIIKRWQDCQNILKNAAEQHRVPCPQLLVVTKTQSSDRIEVLLKQGHRVFGENKVQEALKKWPSLKERYPNITLHFIGHLQTNKIRDALSVFDVIQTLDRPTLIEKISAFDLSGKSFFVQVNSGREPQKSGVMEEELPALLNLCAQHNIPVRGLMCVPPVDQPASLFFQALRRLADVHGLPECSMGMSQDMVEAVAAGSTCIRLGGAIFRG